MFLTCRTKFNLDSISPDEEEHPHCRKTWLSFILARMVKNFLGHKISRGEKNEGAYKTHKISIPPW